MFHLRLLNTKTLEKALYEMLVKRFLYHFWGTILIVLMSFSANASHIMGGTITYECTGNGSYIFQLVFYRDCNGAQVNTHSQTIRVWNHPTLTSITLPYVSTEDISPQGTNVAGSPSCFNCTTPNGNLGIGSIQRVVYRSNPTVISGVPPTDGWIFTFDDFSRNGNITNLQNPLNYGITLTAKIFNVNHQNNTCNDNSPKFLQNPHFVSCIGKPFKLNLNPVDPDLDSIHISFDKPLNNLNNNPYQEGVNPTTVPFVSGFSFNNPTPTSAMMAGNQNAQIDNQSGEITFQSFIAGNFNVKIKVTSFRNGQRISEVVHEMQLIVTHCNATNNPPVIAPPFAGTFTTTVAAGSAVNFNLSSTDAEVLFNGTPQSNSIHPTGLLFGPNPTVNTGCLIAPCPTISSMPPIVGTQGANVQFNWQTSCDHLKDATGNELDIVPYQFVFRVQDDYCPVPEVVYQTVTINVVNAGVIQAPSISCIKGANAGDFTLHWNPVADPTGSFVAYQIRTVQNGVIATINNITTNSYTHTGVTTDLDYFITVVSGCGGHAYRHSDTVSNIFLKVTDVNPGVAVLDWNKPTSPKQATMSGYYHIYKEYPAGTWTFKDSVPYNTTHYEDVIDICGSTINYQIILKNTPCDYQSQIGSGFFTDQTPPCIPTVQRVTIDSLTNKTLIEWSSCPEPDTKGYIIYKQDPTTGLLVEVDTVYGRLTTQYDYLEAYIDGAMTYTVAAFDSCPSPTGAPFNLSARDPNFHTTIYLKNQFSICDGKVKLTWSPYIGWTPISYDVFIKENSGPWQLVHTTTGLSYSFVGTDLVNYQVVIRANKGDGLISVSNKKLFVVNSLTRPSFSYIQYATVPVGENKVEISYTHDEQVLVTKIALQRLNDGVFETIQEAVNPVSPHVFIDEDVQVTKESYTYRVIYFDSCGNAGLPSNIARTVLLTSQINNTSLKTYINWSPYVQFNGGIDRYEVYRTVDGIYEPTPIAVLPANQLAFEEDVFDMPTEGSICYRIVAWENLNVFNDRQKSVSNDACVLVEPLIYIPNSFTPNGDEFNNVFKPIVRSFNLSSYHFTIFNRMGGAVYRTDDPDSGWDGLDKSGREMMSGTYLYVVEFNDGNGEQVVRRGHVNLLR